MNTNSTRFACRSSRRSGYLLLECLIASVLLFAALAACNGVFMQSTKANRRCSEYTQSLIDCENALGRACLAEAAGDLPAWEPVRSSGMKIRVTRRIIRGGAVKYTATAHRQATDEEVVRLTRYEYRAERDTP